MSVASPSFSLLKLLARHVAVPWKTRQYNRFARLLPRARQVQQDLLLNWVGRCRDSRFGRDHAFSEIRTVDDYRRRAPVAPYATFEPYIQAVGRGEADALFPRDERVERFTITTGSTGVPKLNPVTPSWLRTYRQSWDVWGIKLLADHPRQVGGKILQIVGSWNMGQTEGGLPISMVSALLARNQHPLVRPFYAIPAEVTDIPNPEARYYTTLRLCIGEPIALIVLMNPGSLIRLVKLADQHRESLIRDIHNGTLSDAFDVPQPIRERLRSRISRPDPDAARRLAAIVERTGRLLPRDYWNEPMIACWLGGTAGYQSRSLHEYFGDAPLRDQGLVSSEGRHTIPIADGKPEGVLSIESGFYEFIPVEEGAGDRPVVLEGHELEEDRDYRIILTTYSGYFRFDIGDIVRCRGFVGEAPILEFLQKADRCGDLEGEKVTEHQFLDAATASARELGLSLGYVTAVPRRNEPDLPRYVVLADGGDVPGGKVAERFLGGIDKRLASGNFLYSARRREGVLAPPQLWRLPDGAWERYVEAEIARRGTGDVHYKHPGLVQDAGWLRRFAPMDVIEMSMKDASGPLRVGS